MHTVPAIDMNPRGPFNVGSSTDTLIVGPTGMRG